MFLFRWIRVYLLAPRQRQQHSMAIIMKMTQTPDTDQKATEMGVFGSHQYCNQVRNEFIIDLAHCWNIIAERRVGEYGIFLHFYEEITSEMIWNYNETWRSERRRRTGRGWVKVISVTWDLKKFQVWFSFFFVPASSSCWRRSRSVCNLWWFLCEITWTPLFHSLLL